MSEQISTKVITGKVRFAYCHVFAPHAMDEDEKPKYSVCLLIDKKDKKTLAKINAAIEGAIKLGVNKVWGGKKPAKTSLKLPLRDGDEERDELEEFEGKLFVNANSKRKPGVIDLDKEDLYDEDDFGSGDYGRAAISFYAFSGKSKGIACSLENLQLIEKGEPLGAKRSTAQEDFDDDEYTSDTESDDDEY